MINLEVITSYSFLMVALGTLILAMASGAVGCITVLKGESLIGDAVGHAAYPGIIFAFILSLQKDPEILLLGAISFGALAFIFIQLIHRYSKLDLDAALAIILSSFFGGGMVLKSHIQGNPNYSGASQAGLQNYIFGQAAYILKEDIFLISAVAIPSLLLLFLFYKELKVFIFDEIYSKTIGINTSFIYSIILFMTMSLIGVGLKVVGSILISSLFVVPAITALQWSNQFHKVLLIASLTGGISAVLGTYFSTIYRGLSTGPMIVVIMSLLAFFSLLFGPHGTVANMKMRRRYR